MFDEGKEKTASKADFQVRSKATTFKVANVSVDYVPHGAAKLTEEHIKRWGIKEDDYFTIYFEKSNLLLDYFQQDLIDTGVEINVAKQHRSQVKNLTINYNYIL